MTLDEAIKNMETIAEGNQLAIDTGIIFSDTPTDIFYCDNAEVKNKRLENYQRCAEEHRQLAEWLKELKQLREQTRWIPVNERLPKIHQDVLLSLRSLDVVVGFRAGTEPYFYSQGDYIEPQNVLAWMPLSQPYKAESEV